MTRITMAALPIVAETDGRSCRTISYLGMRRSRERELTHCNDITSHCVAKGEIPGNSNKYIQECRNANTSNDHSGGSEMRIIAYLVQD